MKRFLAVSSLSRTGRPPSVGDPANEQEFGTQAEAVVWLRGLRCGGAVSDYNRIVEFIEAGW